MNRNMFFKRRSTALWLAVSILLACGQVRCQEPEIQTQLTTEEGPYYVGMPVTFRLQVEGLEEAPEPKFLIDNEVENLRASLEAVNPSSFSQVTIVNGRRTAVSQITYNVIFKFTAEEAGQYEIGPFVVQQGTTEKRVDSVKITFEDVPFTEEMRIELKLPENPIYPDQRVPVELEWWYAGELRDTAVSIYSPIFDKFTFEDSGAAKKTDALLPLQTEKGNIDVPASIRREVVDGRSFTVFKAMRTMVPDQLGEFDLKPIGVTIRRVTKWGRRTTGRGFFRSVEKYPEEVEVLRAEGEPKKIIVGGFPNAGRPESFAGAVGRGFTLDAVANRTVVRVGDPIQLEITLSGPGNLDRLGLPPLSADGGLDPNLFRLPNGDTAGVVERGRKVFNVSVRVKEDSVSEIPSIAYSWFDPESQSYQTTRSKPIALNVKSAQMVSVDDVVSAVTNDANSTRTDSSENTAPNKSQSSGGFVLSGADLAIEPNPGKLLASGGRIFTNPIVQAGIHAIGLLLIAIAWIDRRRSDVDPQDAATRKRLAAQRKMIADASSLPTKQAAAQIANALNVLVAERPDFERVETQRFIGTLEALSYQPGQAGDRIEANVIDEAKGIADRFIEDAKV